mgnify:FL=1
MMTVLYILLAIVVLLFMVLVHELGHYIAGKILKFKITEFSIGFGKAIFSHTSKKTGEKFSFRLFPLGGYCSFYGEDEDGKGDENSFNNQKPWKRIIVFLAGVTMNFITAIIFSWILLCTVGYDTPQIIAYSNSINVGQYQEGDIVTHVNGTKIDFAFGENFNTAISNVKTEAKEQYNAYMEENGLTSPLDIPEENYYEFIMTVKRDGEIKDLTIQVVPYEMDITDSETGETTKQVVYVIGLESDLTGYPCTTAYKYGFFEGLGRAFPMAFGFAWVVLKSLWMLITFQIPITEMGGTITTVATMAEFAQQNIANMLVFIPLISANLAIFNLLPFPALDGAHVLFTVIEWIRGKPINRKVENTIHFVGICILFAFVVIVDILHFVL